MENVERILRPKTAWTMLGISKSYFYALAKTDPNFPKAIELGKNSKGYLLSEVQAYIQHWIKESRPE